MSTTAPQLLSRKTNGAPPANQTAGTAKGKENAKKSSSRGGRDRSGNDHGQSRGSRRPPSSGEKVVVRRLPPGMTEAEFTSILGAEWAVGKGSVDWFSYAPGKVSSDAAKPSIPARAYLHLTKKESTMALNEVVRNATWEDAKNTFNNPSLIAPPGLELALYKKVPNTKKRTDARQGTIDQDPEFMAFLEALANPVPAAEADDADDAKTDSKVTTTPLVEYLKEKKANKGRDSGKGSKHSRQESGTGKGKGNAKDDEASSRKKGREAKSDKASRPTKENVKILTKKPAAEKTTEASDRADSKQTTAPTNGGDAQKINRRAGIAAAARLLQRDLGLSPGTAHRRARQDANKAEKDAKTPGPSGTKDDIVVTATEPAEAMSSPVDKESKAPATASTGGASPTSSGPKSASGGRRNRGGRNADKGRAVDTTASPTPTAANPPMILKKKPEADAVPAEPKETPRAATPTAPPASKAASKAPASKAAGPKKSAAITPGVTRGFVKHANSSQGVTEALLREALQTFGSVTSLELDKRKGFAYVEFADHESLVKAAAASPVTVAQGAVQVLERKDKKPAATTAPTSGAASGAAPSDKPAGGRGRRGRGGGGGKTNAGAKEGGQQTAMSATASGG